MQQIRVTISSPRDVFRNNRAPLALSVVSASRWQHAIAVMTSLFRVLLCVVCVSGRLAPSGLQNNVYTHTQMHTHTIRLDYRR